MVQQDQIHDSVYGEVKIDLMKEMLVLWIGQKSAQFDDSGGLFGLVAKHLNNAPIMLQLDAALAELEKKPESYDALAKLAMSLGEEKEALRYISVAFQVRAHLSTIAILRRAVRGVTLESENAEQKRWIKDLEEANGVLHEALGWCNGLEADDEPEEQPHAPMEEPVIEITKAEVDAAAPNEVVIENEDLDLAVATEPEEPDE